MKVDFINPDGLMKSPAFSQAVITEGSGKTIYIGGQNAVNEKGETIGKGDIAAQTEKIMQNIELLLKACGGSFTDIIKMTIFITQGQDVRKAFEASQKYMPKTDSPPIVTALFVAGMGNPDYLLEIEAIAVINHQ